MSSLDPLALEQALAERASAAGWAWLERAREQVRREPSAIVALFPTVGRSVGHTPLHLGAHRGDVHAWTVDAAARTLLLLALGPAADGRLAALYRHGDTAERCGVLRALAFLPVTGAVGLPLVEDALRTHDPRLVAAALGPYALARLDDDAVVQAVLKCLFVGVPLAGLDGVEARATPALADALARYVDERVAAGREVPAEVWPLVSAGRAGARAGTRPRAAAGS